MTVEVMESLTEIDRYISMCGDVIRKTPTMPRRLITIIEAEIENVRDELNNLVLANDRCSGIADEDINNLYERVKDGN